MKKWALFLAIPVVFFISFKVINFSEKESTKEEIYNSFVEKISSISSYNCVADVEVFGNKTPTKYRFKHTFKSPNSYIVQTILPEELKGQVVEYVDSKIIVKNTNIKDTIELPNEGEVSKNLFIGDFINNFKSAKDVKLQSDKNYLILEINIESESEYFDKQILYVNKKDKVPYKMEILDKNKEKRFEVVYSDFKYNK